MYRDVSARRLGKRLDADRLSAVWSVESGWPFWNARSLIVERDGSQMRLWAAYLMPVNADIAVLEAFFVDEHDPHVNPLDVKGIAELAIIGVAPAIANAVFHATGKRVRELPIVLEKLL
jgi:xanthine dehydrogenase YagR molybdenum-binding subunit